MIVENEVFTKAAEKISNNDCSGLQEILKNYNIPIDAEDDNGMTLLHHAAFKGKKEICQLLLDLGANPNGGHHEHKYTTLHFAALSGNVDICQQMLQYGAVPDALNSVGRTAAQMAAFVGNHNCVSVINNFIPREDIDQFTVPFKGQTEPKLPPAVAPALHKFVMQVNLHPIHLLLTLQNFPLLLENLSKVKDVLETLTDSQMKRNREANEVLSLKYHYLCFLVGKLAKERHQHPDKPALELVNQFIKAFLKRRTGDGFPEFMDNFVRESIRTFPYKETTVFRQLVLSLSKTKQKADSSLAITFLNSCINGQRGFTDDDSCATCGEEKVPRKCANCKAVQYCDRECQKLHWPIHKKECDSLAEMMRKAAIKESSSTSADQSSAETPAAADNTVTET